MRFQCIVSYRTTRSKGISSWRTSAQGTDVSSVTANVIEKLKRRQRRALTVVGIYVWLQDRAKT